MATRSRRGLWHRRLEVIGVGTRWRVLEPFEHPVRTGVDEAPAGRGYDAARLPAPGASLCVAARAATSPEVMLTTVRRPTAPHRGRCRLRRPGVLGDPPLDVLAAPAQRSSEPDCGRARHALVPPPVDRLHAHGQEVRDLVDRQQPVALVTRRNP